MIQKNVDEKRIMIFFFHLLYIIGIIRFRMSDNIVFNTSI